MGGRDKEGTTNLLRRGTMLTVTRPGEILEIGAFWSICKQDVTSFDRYFFQLQTFYTDYTTLPRSQHEYPICGLHLIRLLTQNRIADFHTALESLSAAAFKSPYIVYPVNLERWLMEDSYAKVWSARAEVPAAEYGYFIDSLVGTIRNEIASCHETAYESLSVKAAVTLLFFTSQSELLVFAQERRWEVNLILGTIMFGPKGKKTMDIPKERIISASLLYERQLEQIV
ncbi:SAC3/GANP/Nin1/mts3/eIF-3 p25 family-domain-containing protein [Mycena olivaceomarginata]|nr:SAC3/GANP/Nin1/mts3/eIF-3 p25 family-domain-containing protein [Mycena olivaceomarginata]